MDAPDAEKAIDAGRVVAIQAEAAENKRRRAEADAKMKEYQEQEKEQKAMLKEAKRRSNEKHIEKVTGAAVHGFVQVKAAVRRE